MSVEGQARKVAWGLRASGIDRASLVVAARSRIERRESVRDSLVIAEARRLRQVNGEALRRNALRRGDTEAVAEIERDFGLGET